MLAPFDNTPVTGKPSPPRRGYFFLPVRNCAFAGLICLLPGVGHAAVDAAPSAAQRAQLEFLLQAEQEGLEPSDYAATALARLADRPGEAAYQAFPQRLAAAFARYSRDLSAGRLDPALDPGWHLPRQPRDAHIPFAEPVSAAAIRDYQESLLPPHPQYRHLRSLLQRLLDIRTQGGWPPLPPGPDLQPGTRDERVIPLRNRLRISGHYRADMQADPLYFDAGLADAVRRFQAEHALWIDGVVGDRTLEALNVPVAQRIDQLKVTLERWRWLPRKLGNRHIEVNIAAGRLEVIEAGQPRLAMRAIVGRPYRQTPSLQGLIDRITINPAWTIPHRIAVEDLLPQQQRDPSFLDRNRIRVFSTRDGLAVDSRSIDWAQLAPERFVYTLRQDAGPDNSLGRLKFSFDNPYDIYLHGTPNPVLFRLPGRTFSSGCVRLEDPLQLAEYLLGAGRQLQQRDVQALIDAGTTRSITLQLPVPVYLLYMNVWADADGNAHFGSDPYARDQPLLAAWQRPRPLPAADTRD